MMTLMAKPPPPPPPAPAAVPKGARARLDLAESALRLRDEQLQARVVYVDPELQTNAELDAITAEVVEELKALQRQSHAGIAQLDPQEVEIELIKHLRDALEKLLSDRRQQFLRLKIERIQRRVTQVYFSSEVSADVEAPQAKRDQPYAHGDEVLFHALRRVDADVLKFLDAQNYADPRVRIDAVDRWQLFQKQLVSQVLTRAMPELERLLAVYREVLFQFLMTAFREAAPDFAWRVVRESRVAETAQLTYKIKEDGFAAFRKSYEHHFLAMLLEGIDAPLAKALTEQGPFRQETLRFAGEPQVFAEICGVMCNAMYEFLHGEGFLDLPVAWQEHLEAGR